jgi:hypothetical protein
MIGSMDRTRKLRLAATLLFFGAAAHGAVRAGPKVPAAPPALPAAAALSPNIPAMPAPVNVTPDYRAAWSNPDAALDLAELRKTKVLLVPGFLTGPLLRMGQLPGWKGHRYFGELMDWLKSNKIDYELVPVHTGQSFAHNGAIIADSIANSKKKVLVVSHSKGGRDTLEALISRPDLRPRVRAWVPVQAPFRGTPLAGLNGLRMFAYLLPMFGGSKDSGLSLSERDSREYYLANEKEIADIISAIPIVAFTSYVSEAPLHWLKAVRPVFKWTWRAIRARAGRNDSMVPAASAALPGMRFVSAPEVDHFSPFLKTPRVFDRLRMIKSLLALVLKNAS